MLSYWTLLDIWQHLLDLGGGGGWDKPSTTHKNEETHKWNGVRTYKPRVWMRPLLALSVRLSHVNRRHEQRTRNAFIELRSEMCKWNCLQLVTWSSKSLLVICSFPYLLSVQLTHPLFRNIALCWSSYLLLPIVSRPQPFSLFQFTKWYFLLCSWPLDHAWRLYLSNALTL